jgi:drug/metabolite transporter (DMT)-like permease
VVWLAFSLLSLAWGSSYLFIRVGVEQLSPLALVALRLGIGAVGLWGFAIVRRLNLRLTRRQLASVAVLGTINTAIPFLLISWGEETVQSGLASVLNSTVPIFSFLIAGAVLQDEPITVPRIGGVAIGFGGVLVLLSRDLSHGAIHWSGLGGQGAIVLASAFYAISAVFARKTLRGAPSMTIALHALSIAAAEILVLSLIFSPPPLASLHLKSLFAVVWLGLLGSSFAYLLYYFILENWGASRTTLITYALPVVGLALGSIVLHESIDWRTAAGSALVIAGIALASVVKRRTRKDAALQPVATSRGANPAGREAGAAGPSSEAG